MLTSDTDVGISPTTFKVDLMGYNASMNTTEAPLPLGEIPCFFAVAFALDDVLKEDAADGILAFAPGQCVSLPLLPTLHLL